MKSLFFIVSLLLAGCSTCKIPISEFSSIGGSETDTSLSLENHKYLLTFEYWSPGGYEKRVKTELSGRWSCEGNFGVFITESGEAKAEYKSIGQNPVGLPEKTKALVFGPSDEQILSNELLYKKSETK